MTRLMALSLAAALLAAAPAGAQQGGRGANLLVNGSFESGANPGFSRLLDKGSTEITGWTVTRGSIDYVRDHSSIPPVPNCVVARYAVQDGKLTPID